MTAPDPTRAWFASASAAFLRRHPFFAAVLARMTPVGDPGVTVMAVAPYGPGYRLHVNPDFFARRENRRFATGVLLHEVHHVALGHLSDPRFAGLPHPDLIELAMEVSANENIRSPLPGDPPRWEMYREFGLRPGQSTMERYELLARGRGNGKEPPPPNNWADDHLPGGVGRVWGGKPPKKPPPPAPPPQSRLQSLIARFTGRGKDGPAVAAGPGDGTARGGATGGTVMAVAAPTNPAPQLDWRRMLRVFRRARRREADYRRPSRRLPDLLGVVPGRTRRPTALPLHLIAAIDTSSSMTADEVTRIGATLADLRRRAGAVTLTVVECDQKIHRVYRLKGKLASITGRGGTDLRPVFARDVLKKHRPDGVIYFTDGDGEYPPDPPPVPTLWVLTKPRPFACKWGHRARL